MSCKREDGDEYALVKKQNKKKNNKKKKKKKKKKHSVFEMMPFYISDAFSSG